MIIKSFKSEFQKFNNKKVKVYIINDRYHFYNDIPVIHDTIYSKDIPQVLFKIRQSILEDNYAKSI